MFKLFPKVVYIYKKVNGDDGLCVYVCDTDNANEVVIGCIDEPNLLNTEVLKINKLNKVLYLDRYEVIRPSSIIKPLYFNHEKIIINSIDFNILTHSICKLLLVKYEKMLNNLMLNNFNSKEDKLTDIMLPEKMIKLLTWNLKKCELKFEKQTGKLKVMKYFIYLAYMGTNIGAEIEKLRPVVVWRQHINVQNRDDDNFFVFPISSKKIQKKYYYNVSFELDNKENIIKVNAGKLISGKRIMKPYIDSNNNFVELNAITIKKVKEAIKKYFGIES